MIESLKAINFQSLHNVDIEFGKFTVIVGPSSSGKSALTRAMKAVTSNALHSDYITRGTKKASVSLKTEDTTITIERELGDSSVYKIAKSGSEESRFARLNRQVPAQVTAACGIAASTQEVASINFAGQFDTPYLLKEGASSVARVLGELTNVSTIFAAVKEANRRTKNASSLISLRKKDEASLLQDLTKFQTIAQDAQAITQVEQLLADCAELEAEIAQMQQALRRADEALRALQAIKKIPDLPDLASLLETYQQFNQLKTIVTTAAHSKNEINNYSAQLAQSRSNIEQAENELHTLLKEAGTCPTCNQEIC